MGTGYSWEGTHTLCAVLMTGQKGYARVWEEIADGNWIYCCDIKTWMRYDQQERIWQQDERGTWFDVFSDSMQRVIDKELEYYAQQDAESRKGLTDEALKNWKSRYEGTEKALAQAKKNCGNAGFVAGVMKFCSRMTKKLSDFDWSECTLFENGYLDTETLAFHGNAETDALEMRSKLFTRKMSSPYVEGLDFEVDGKPYYDFLMSTFSEDLSVLPVLQQIFGVCLTKNTDMDKIFCLVGDGGNGKSRFQDMVMGVWGEYAITFDSSLLLEKSSSGDKEQQKARLRNMFIAMSDDVSTQSNLSASIIKQISGGDKIVSRKLYQDAVAFTPTHKMFLMMNDAPKVPGADFAIVRRLVIIRFQRNFLHGNGRIPKSQLMRGFADETAKAAFVGWCVDGLRKFREQGEDLDAILPESMCAELKAFEKDNDVMARFIEERLTKSKGARTAFGEVYTQFLQWANGKEKMSSIKFKRALKSRGIKFLSVKNTDNVIADYEVKNT